MVGFIGAGTTGLQAPDAPTIGTATDLASATGGEVSITFTAPTDTGGGAITEYIVTAEKTSDSTTVSTTGSSSPITISGLTNDTAYTIRVLAVNAYGPSQYSADSNSVTPTQSDDAVYVTEGTYTFVVPSGLSPATISAVCVGGGGSGYGSGSGSGDSGGGGGGAALAYVNNQSVTAGQSWTVIVGAGGVSTGQNGSLGGSSQLRNPSSTTVLRANGGTQGAAASGGAGGTVHTGTGGSGGAGGGGSQGGANWWPAGGGGAGGYAGNGGAGANSTFNGSSGGAAPSGGGSGGGATGYGLTGGPGGGGTGLYGQGSSGGSVSVPSGGRRGSYEANGVTGAQGEHGRNYNSEGGGAATGGRGGYPGGGGGGANPATNNGGLHYGGPGGTGALRIVYAFNGTTRTFPSTNVGP